MVLSMHCWNDLLLTGSDRREWLRIANLVTRMSSLTL